MNKKGTFVGPVGGTPTFLAPETPPPPHHHIDVAPLMSHRGAAAPAPPPPQSPVTQERGSLSATQLHKEQSISPTQPCPRGRSRCSPKSNVTARRCCGPARLSGDPWEGPSRKQGGVCYRGLGDAFGSLGTPRYPQDWGQRLGAGGHLDFSALPLVAGQTMHCFLCLWGDLDLGNSGREAPRSGQRGRKGSIGVS